MPTEAHPKPRINFCRMLLHGAYTASCMCSICMWFGWWSHWKIASIMLGGPRSTLTASTAPSGLALTKRGNSPGFHQLAARPKRVEAMRSVSDVRRIWAALLRSSYYVCMNEYSMV